jgi:hypothetical protein
MLVRLIVIAVAMLMDARANAQVSCGDPPRDIPVAVTESIEGDVQGTAQFFTRLLGDASIGGKIQKKRQELYERHINIDKSQIDRYTIWVSCQNIMSATNLSAQQKNDLFLSVYRNLMGQGSESAIDPALTDYHTIVTENIGLQFRQDGRVLPIKPINDDAFAVQMYRRAFEVVLSERNWTSTNSDYPALQITVSDKPGLFELAEFDTAFGSEKFFYPGTGMADAQHGAGRLFAITDLSAQPFGHNYIVGARFNIEEERRRGFYVSAILSDSDENLLQTAPSLYLVCYLDSTDSDLRDHSSLDARQIDPFDVDLVRLDFIE